MSETKVVNCRVDFRHGVKEIEGGSEFQISSTEFKDVNLSISYVSRSTLSRAFLLKTYALVLTEVNEHVCIFLESTLKIQTTRNDVVGFTTAIEFIIDS